MENTLLTEPQLDALRELGNIGAGHASTSLSELTGRLVTLDVPDVRLADLSEVAFLLGPPETLVMGVILRVEGDIEGQVLLALVAEEARQLGRTLLGDAGADEELAFSAVAESGNILAGAYLGALERLTGLTAQPSVPGVAMDMAGALITSLVAQDEDAAAEALIIDARFLDAGKALQGHFLLFPAARTLPRLLRALGLS